LSGSAATNSLSLKASSKFVPYVPGQTKQRFAGGAPQQFNYNIQHNSSLAEKESTYDKTTMSAGKSIVSAGLSGSLDMSRGTVVDESGKSN